MFEEHQFVSGKPKDPDRAPPSPKRFSEKVANFSWTDHFPLKISEDEWAEIVDYKTVARFVVENYHALFPNAPEDSPFTLDGITDRKLRYYELAGDCFAFMSAGKVVGVFVGNLVDWTTYYFRWMSLLPSHQGGGRYNKLFNHLLDTLVNQGFHRVEVDVSPANFGTIHNLTKLNFNISGVTLSDRWGSLLKFTRFLKDGPELTFLDQFCHGDRPQLARRKTPPG